jgi:hypothetical protein
MAKYLLQNTVTFTGPHGSITLPAGREIDEATFGTPIAILKAAGASLVPITDAAAMNAAISARRTRARGGNPETDPGLPFAVDTGFRIVSTLAERDAIQAEMRVSGQHVYVVETATTYRLGAGLTNGEWSIESGVSEAATVAILTTRSGATGELIYLTSKKAVLLYDPNAPLTVDNIDVYATANGGTSRWLRTNVKSFIPSSQATWFIDPSAGNDENDGLGSGTAIKTFAELLRRTAKTFLASTTITLLGSLPSSDPFSLDDVLLGQSVQILVTGAPTTARTGTISAQTAISPGTNTPQSGTDGVISWAADVKKRFRNTTAGPRLDQLSWVAKNSGGGAARFSRMASIPLTLGSVATVSVGLNTSDTYEIQDLVSVTMPRMSIRAIPGASVVGACIEFRNIQFNRANTLNFDPETYENSVLTIFKGCRFDGYIVTAGPTSAQVWFVQCCFTLAFILSGNFVIFLNGAFIGLIACQIRGPSLAQFVGDTLIQGCNPLEVRMGSDVENDSGLSIFDGSDIGMKIFEGAAMRGGGRLWGSGNAGVGLQVQGDGRYNYATAQAPLITGSGGDFRCGNTALGLVMINPTSGAALASINQTWTLLGTALPTGFGNNVINPVNSAGICVQV